VEDKIPTRLSGFVDHQAGKWEEHYAQDFDGETLSGDGSSWENTKEIRQALPLIFIRRKIHTFTDIPCGDWNWMRHVDLSGVDYLGCDVVPEVIQSNRECFPEHSFQVLNLVTEVPRRSDLILCRDLLFHLSNKWILQALANIRASQSEWLMSTSFPYLIHGINRDITMENCIRWRPINLCLPPFSLPNPIEWVQENNSPACRGRIVGLWRVEDIPEDPHG